MFEPKNEQGVVALFCMIAEVNGWEIEEIQTEYPDARIKKDGISWMVEFEYKSANFIQHNHDIRECDMIICWKHNYKNCPIPVIELGKPDAVNGVYELVSQESKEIEYWYRRAVRAEYLLNKVKPCVTCEPIVKPRPRTNADEQQIMSEILAHYEAHPKCSLGRAHNELGYAKSTISKYLEKLSDDGHMIKDADGKWTSV